ncbi:MAG: YCF48-related protein [Acidobacteria bacterium]|nr:YCF48-related protein [Acidobacteriota bacterium]
MGKTEAAADAISPTKSPSTPQREASRGELTAKDVVVKMDKLQRANEAGTVESAQAAQAEKDKGGRLAEGASASVAGRAMPKQADEEKQIAAAESRVVVAQPAAPAVAGAAPSGVQAAQGISGGVQGAQKQDQVVVAAETKAATAQVTSEMPGQKQAALKKERAAVRQDTDAGRYALQTTPQSVAGYRARTDEILLTTPNSKVIWRLGSAGRIERSRDAGKTWEAQKALTQESLLSGSAPAENICWVGGSNGVLLRTTDGGENWERIPSPTKIAIVSIKATDQLTATVTTADGRTYETRDAGAHWRAR